MLHFDRVLLSSLYVHVMCVDVSSCVFRWVSLSILTVGVALTQLSKTQEAAAKDDTSSAKLFTGFMTVMIAICLSGFAGQLSHSHRSDACSTYV